jgi:hypothetical protein
MWKDTRCRLKGWWQYLTLIFGPGVLKSSAFKYLHVNKIIVSHQQPISIKQQSFLTSNHQTTTYTNSDNLMLTVNKYYSSWPNFNNTCKVYDTVLALIFFNYLPKTKFRKKKLHFCIYSNKFFLNFHLFESSFNCPRLRASVKTADIYCTWYILLCYQYCTSKQELFFLA